MIKIFFNRFFTVMSKCLFDWKAHGMFYVFTIHDWCSLISL